MTAFTAAVPVVLYLLAESGLTLRELEVIDATADGLSIAEVGVLLGLSELTVKNHLSRSGLKAGVGTRSGIVGYAYWKGLLVRVPAPVVPMTGRQKELLPQVARGLENRAIGVRLGITEDTVKAHLYACARLLGSRTRAHMVRRAVDTGLLPLTARTAS